MLRIDQIVKGSVEQLDIHGTGILAINRDRVYVTGVLPGESVRVKIVKRIKGGYVGTVVQIDVPSPVRIESPCRISKMCGSCHYLHIEYAHQLKMKKKAVISLCMEEHLPLYVHDVIGMNDPYAYRNKIIAGFSRDKKGTVVTGFYEEHSHRIIPYERCRMHDAICDRIIQTIQRLLQAYRIEPYDEDRRKGILRHVLIRKGAVTGNIMVVLVTAQKVFPGMRNFLRDILKEHPEITTIIQNINMRKTSVVLGNEEKVLYGPGYIEDVLCGLRFGISSRSFYQINHDQCEALYKKAVELLELTGNEVLLDAYCGIGTIGMYAASHVKEVIGVESNKDAVKDAQANARYNRIKNIRFICDDAGSCMAGMAQRKQHVDAVIMDPPRSGSTVMFMEAVSKLKPGKVVYISCNPKTQIRDLKHFAKLEYHAKELFLFDMFPHTYHVESVCLLSNLNRANILK